MMAGKRIRGEFRWRGRGGRVGVGGNWVVGGKGYGWNSLVGGNVVGGKIGLGGKNDFGGKKIGGKHCIQQNEN